MFGRRRVRRNNPRPSMTLAEARAVLGVSATATPAEVRAAYRKLAIEHHPDRGGDPEAMKRLNEAREIVESGVGASASAPYSETPPGRGGAYWRRQAQQQEQYRRWRRRARKVPSDDYDFTDLLALAQWVLSRGLIQTMYREPVGNVPFDAVFSRSTGNYGRPFGSVRNTKRLPKDVDAMELATALVTYARGDLIFDMGRTEGEAWVTWENWDPENAASEYRSVSFQKPRVRKKRKKGAAKLSQPGAALKLRDLGLGETAGGSRYRYFGPRGSTEKTGLFVRLSARTARLVERVRTGRGIKDYPLEDEVYYGSLTEQQLQRWAQRVQGQ